MGWATLYIAKLQADETDNARQIMLRRFFFWFSILLLVPESLAVAGSPRLARIYPPGGQRGTSVPGRK